MSDKETMSMGLLHRFLIVLLMPSIVLAAESIDRRALVERHNITFTQSNSAEIPQVGNGEIAFGIDVTGLQTLYGNTFSQWGWHTLPLPEGKKVEDFKMTEVKVHGRIATYPVSSKGQKELYGWLRSNRRGGQHADARGYLRESHIDPASTGRANGFVDVGLACAFSDGHGRGLGWAAISTANTSAGQPRAGAVQYDAAVAPDGWR